MLDDYELLYLASEKNEDAISELLKKYYWLINYKAIKNMTSEQDKDDFINEGILSFYNAINSYTDKANTKFITYLNSCLDKSMINLKKSILRKKHYVFNNAISLEDNLLQLDKELSDIKNEPNKIIMEKDDYTSLKNKILKKLNSNEELVFILKEQNFTVKEISQIIDMKLYDIYNIIKRIRYKTNKILSN